MTLALRPFADTGNQATRYLNPDRIMAVTSDFFDVPLDVLKGRGRTRPVSQARYTTFWLLKKWTRIANDGIGHLFGRNHSTVMYGIATANEWIRDKPALRRLVAEIEGELIEQEVNSGPVSVGSEAKEGESDGE